MSDTVCDTCNVPKPPICFDHAEARHGSHRGTCQSCMTRIRSRRSAAWRRTPAGIASAKRSKAHQIELHAEEYAARMAAWCERKGAA